MSPEPAIHAVVHRTSDAVAVAVIPGIGAGRRIDVWHMDDDSRSTLEVREAIPLGHKIAMRDIAAGDDVLKYGHSIGKASIDIRAGQHVHIHNLRSCRW